MPSFFVVNLDGVVVVGSTASFSPSSSSSMMTMGIKCSVSVPSGGPPGGPLPRGLERLPAGRYTKDKTLNPKHTEILNLSRGAHNPTKAKR